LSELPTVTVIVLNYNGLEHLGACFASLKEVNYPSQKLELMMVDNASTDGSVEFMRETYPEVQIVTNDENRGFASGNNVGAGRATSEYVVFLNNDMRVDPLFVKGLVEPILEQEDVVCAGAKILNWEGTEFDFTTPAAHFAGYAYQLGVNEPYDQDKHTLALPILFACGGAMLIERELFLEIGGFDDDYFMLYEDLDLGWRLWLLGYRIVFAPNAIVYHRHHGTVRRVSDQRKRVLYKRNALYSVIKNYEDENLSRILPAVLMGSIEGVVEKLVAQGSVNLEDFDIKGSSTSRQPTIRMSKEDAGTLVAVYQIVHNLPETMRKRRYVQENRKRPDGEVAHLFRRPFRFWPDVAAPTQYQVLDAFGVQEVFADSPRRVLIVSSDILPYPGLPTVGSGLRAWGLGQGLRARGHDVVFSMPRAALSGRRELVPHDVQELTWENHTLGSVVRRADPDIVIVCNWPVMALMPTELLDMPVILDQHGPHFLEREYQGAGDPEENAIAKMVAMRKADFFTCAGERQWRYFQSWLERAGWTEEQRDERTGVVPVSLSPELPERAPADSLTFVYGGVFLPWQDPSVGLFSLIEVMERRDAGQLCFFGGKHPVYAVNTGIFDELLARLQESEYVVTPGMVSHDELIRFYLQAHVAIDLMKRNPERELAFTTRTVEYLWCGLPVIYNDYSELSDYIREYNAGWTVDPEDHEAVAAVIEDIFAHPEQIAERGRNAQRLVREKLNWHTNVAPIDRFVRYPRMRPHPDVEHSGFSRVARNVRYYLNEARFHYQQRGLGGLLRETFSFVGRQVGF